MDSPGRVMYDFHTAQNEKNQQKTRKEGIGEAQITKRFYLADARFLVGLEGADAAFLRQLEAALRDPVWTLCLGRKSFPLSEPPYLPDGSLYAGPLEEALQRVTWLVRSRPRAWQSPEAEILRCVLEAPDGDSVQMDAPRDFSARQFDLRRLKQSSVPAGELPKYGPEGKPCISRD